MHLARVRLRGRKEEKRREMIRLGTSRANITHTPNISCDGDKYMYCMSGVYSVVGSSPT